MVSVNFSNVGFESMIDVFGKTISRTPVTKTTDNVTGDEILTDGSSSNITGAFFRKEDSWVQDKVGLLRGADAVVLVKDDVTINRDDKLAYDGETYRVNDVVLRRLGNTSFYTVGFCFKIS